MVSDYTPPPVTQATLKGAPSVTVSPVGLAQGLPRNNNANFGPDTPGTTTSGIQEAIKSGATWLVLLSGTFNTSSTIFLPSAYGIRLEGAMTSREPFGNTGQPQTWINYSGNSGFAIDTASSPAPANGTYTKGYINGLTVICSGNGSGIHLNDVNCDIGALVVGGLGGANPVGFQYDPISQPTESNIDNLSVYGFEQLIVTTAEHLSISHLSTAYTAGAANPVFQHQGYSLTVGYWHHFLNGTVQPTALLSLTNGTARNVWIGNLLCEGSVYSSFSTAYFLNPGGAPGTPIVVGMFGGPSMLNGDQPTPAQLGAGVRILWGNSGPVAPYIVENSEVELTVTTPVTIVTETPVSPGNFIVNAYMRVIAAATVLTLTVTWTDVSGPQSYTWLSAQTEQVGSYTFAPVYLNSTATAITVTATAGTANQVFVSATIEGA